MSKTLAQLAVEFEKWDGLTGNCSMASIGFGRTNDRAGRFADYVRCQEAVEYYSEAKLTADPQCPQYRGEGVLPTNFGALGPYMNRCGCTWRTAVATVTRQANGGAACE
jgi:hypothetical protein